MGLFVLPTNQRLLRRCVSPQTRASADSTGLVPPCWTCLSSSWGCGH